MCGTCETKVVIVEPKEVCEGPGECMSTQYSVQQVRKTKCFGARLQAEEFTLQ